MTGLRSSFLPPFDHTFRLINLIAGEMGVGNRGLVEGIGQETAQQGRESFCLPMLSFQESTKQLRKLSITAFRIIECVFLRLSSNAVEVLACAVGWPWSGAANTPAGVPVRVVHVLALAHA